MKRIKGNTSKFLYCILLISAIFSLLSCGGRTNRHPKPATDPPAVIPEEHLQVRNAIEGFNSEKEIKEAYSDLEPERMEAFLSAFKEARKELYYRHTDTTKTAWNDSTEIIHYWKTMTDEDYLFAAPSPDSIVMWQAKCEELNTRVGFSWISAGYHTMNQYVTLGDLYSRWYDKGKSIRSIDFILWRLEQFRTDSLKPISIQEKFGILENVISDLLDFDPFFTYEYNNRSALSCELQEFTAELLFREVLKISDNKVAQSLQAEKEAWESYHEALDSTMRILHGDPGFEPNSFYQIIWDARKEDAYIWKKALEDYYYTLSGNSAPERHVTISENRVVREYKNFISTIEEKEYHYPAKMRRKALSYEMTYWRKWMKSRAKVSSHLSGQIKENYDNATNNIRRMKLITLKNRYRGYGIMSNDVYELLIPFTAPDKDLDGPSFEEKW